MGYVEEIRALVGHRPLILVGSVVIVIDHEGRILLEQRKHPAEYWAIPGGLMELGESVEDTARRELYEETKLTIGALTLINVYSGVQNYIVASNGDEFYVVTTAFYTKEYSGELVYDTTESMDFRFFEIDHLPDAIVGSHKKILNEFIDKHFSQTRQEAIDCT